MKQSIPALSLLFTVASCEKTEPAKASEPPQLLKQLRWPIHPRKKSFHLQPTRPKT